MSIRNSFERRAFAALLRLPRGARARRAGPPITIDGNTLDVDIALLDTLRRARGNTDAPLSAERARAAERELFALTNSAPRKGVATHDRVIRGPGGDLAVRVYHPARHRGAAPAIVWFHMGGCVIGDLETSHPWCTEMADQAGAVVVSVDYRLAPEHPFPAAVDDALSAYRWVTEQADGLGVDPRRIAVGGGSAGATLATVVCQQRRHQGQSQPALQILVYPSVDGRAAGGSMDTCADSFPLDRRLIEFFQSQYLPDDSALDDPRVSPARAEDLWGLAPAIVVTAGFDPLRDQGNAYAAALISAGVSVDHRCERSLAHGFTSMGRLRACRNANKRLTREISEALSGR